MAEQPNNRLMRFFNKSTFRKLTVLAQDPSVVDANGKPLTTEIDVPNESLEPGPKGSRFHVIDYDASRNKFIKASARYDDAENDGDPFKGVPGDKLVGDPRFHAQNAFAIASHTLMQFETALGRKVGWACDSGAHQIKIAPHAFAEANAFYSRRDEALMFGYYPGRKRNGRNGDFIFTCLSFDIVAHETTHAILDGLRPGLDYPSSPDQAAFHEGFADIIALLASLTSKHLIGHALHGRKDRIDSDGLTVKALKKTVLLGLGEEMGNDASSEALRDRTGGALRRSSEIVPDKENYAVLRNGEEHELGELLVAALMNAFLAMWTERIAALFPEDGWRSADKGRVIEEGAQAAEHLLRMAIRAIDYMPPVNITFPDFLTALLTADRELVPDDRYKYRRVLKEQFAGYGIGTSTAKRKESAATDPIEEGLWRLPPKLQLTYGFSGHAEMQWDREAMFRFIRENRKALDLREEAFTKVASVRPVMRIAPDGCPLRETVAEYMQIMDVRASDLRELGIRAPDGMKEWERVRLLGGGALIFDDYGSLKYHVGTGVCSKSQTERLQSRWDHGEFEPTAREERRFVRLHRARALRSSAVRKERW